MRHLNRNQWISVVASLAVIAFLLYGDSISNLFNVNTQTVTDGSSEDTLGVEVEERIPGTGVEAIVGDKLTVHYVGRLEDGRVFDSSLDRGQPFTFTLGVGEVIRGWDEGLVGARVGSQRTLIISPSYGYGTNAVGNIPANSILIFEVEVLEVTRP